MGHALRFADTAALPSHLRGQAERKLTPRGASPAPTPTARPAGRQPAKPRRDEEHTEQVVFINRLTALAINQPDMAEAVISTIAIPNGGHRGKKQAGRLKAEGVRAGVSDLFVAHPVGEWKGLWIEMKSKTGSASRDQKDWLTRMAAKGYATAVCRGADMAERVWLAYVAGRELPV